MILTVNSAVFEAMFSTSNCKEVQTGIVQVTDVKAAVIEGLLEYMHRGKIDNLDAIAVDLFKISDKYMVGPLKVCLILDFKFYV
jgi:hypothetical protein